MDPVTIGIVALAFGLAVGSHLLGRRLGRRESPGQDERERIAELEWELRQMQQVDKVRAEREKYLESALAAAEKAREQYRKIAETHEVKIPKPPAPKTVTRQVWNDRLFRGHPSENLKNMEKELAEFMDQEVIVKITVRASDLGGASGHFKALKERGWRDGRGQPDMGPFQFEGHPRRAIADFTTFLMDDDTGLVTVSKNPPGKKLWKDRDSPLSFHVDLTVIETVTPTVPQVQVVEVAVVEERVREVVVEKPVLVEVEKKPVEEEPPLPKEEIRKVVADEIAKREAEKEVERLSQAHAAAERRTTS